MENNPTNQEQGLPDSPDSKASNSTYFQSSPLHSPSPKGKKSLIVIVSIVLLLILAGVITSYYAFKPQIMKFVSTHPSIPTPSITPAHPKKNNSPLWTSIWADEFFMDIPYEAEWISAPDHLDENFHPIKHEYEYKEKSASSSQKSDGYHLQVLINHDKEKSLEQIINQDFNNSPAENISLKEISFNDISGYTFTISPNEPTHYYYLSDKPDKNIIIKYSYSDPNDRGYKTLVEESLLTVTVKNNALEEKEFNETVSYKIPEGWNIWSDTKSTMGIESPDFLLGEGRPQVKRGMGITIRRLPRNSGTSIKSIKDHNENIGLSNNDEQTIGKNTAVLGMFNLGLLGYIRQYDFLSNNYHWMIWIVNEGDSDEEYVLYWGDHQMLVYDFLRSLDFKM